jgi:hypothetical protein
MAADEIVGAIIDRKSKAAGDVIACRGCFGLDA